jgi:hypothetical protein
MYFRCDKHMMSSFRLIFILVGLYVQLIHADFNWYFYIKLIMRHWTLSIIFFSDLLSCKYPYDPALRFYKENFVTQDLIEDINFYLPNSVPSLVIISPNFHSFEGKSNAVYKLYDRSKREVYNFRQAVYNSSTSNSRE